MSLDQFRHIVTAKNCFLSELAPIDWSKDLTLLHRQNAKILRRLAQDRVLLRELILSARDDPYLWSKCEEDVVEDKIVLWDDVKKNIRIRLRMSVAEQQRLAHCHRFSFTNMVLRGSYVHWIYRPLASFDAMTRLDDVRTVAQHVDCAGDIFSIHHETLHSTPFPEPGTISLVLRGNPVKERAPVMFKEARGRQDELKRIRGSGIEHHEFEPTIANAGDFFWRVGEERESDQRRTERRMGSSKIDHWLKELESYGILEKS